MKNKLLIGMATGLLMICEVGMTNASIVTITASGNVDSVLLTPWLTPVPNYLMGLDMTTVAVFQTDDSSIFIDPNIGQYENSLKSLTLTLDGQLLTSPPEEALNKFIQITNDHYSFGDNFAVGADFLALSQEVIIPELRPWDEIEVVFALRDYEGLLWSTTAIPMSFDMSLIDFQSISAIFRPLSHDYKTSLRATITSFDVRVSPDPVPVPSTIILLGTGIAALGGCRLRRKNSEIHKDTSPNPTTLIRQDEEIHEGYRND